LLHERDEEMIARVLEPTGVDFEELATRGTVWLEPEPVVQFADLEFPTPSGRVEIASEQAQAAGHPRVPEPYADPRPDSKLLRLLSPASPWLLNDSFANDAKLTYRLGEATVKMHPLDAADRGLEAGDAVLLESQTGRLTLTVELSDELPRGVVYSPKGRWPKREAGAANVNVLNPGVESDMGRSTTVHGVEVAISRA
jgi:anaerobic selenocysteine-containing dehydrogenase